MNTVELAGKVVELLGSAAQQVGQTASQAFPHVVRYTMAKALTGVFVGSVFILLSIYGYRQWRSWVTTKERTSEGEDVAGVIHAIMTLAGAAIGAIAISGYLPDLFAPTGATIMMIVQQLHH